MQKMLAWLVAYFCRWLPHSTETGLFPIGHPDRHSPVLVTANFSLTVARVRRAIEGLDVWLLVANAKGINVWCAADGGIFNEQRIIDAVKVSELAEKVDHRTLILPPLCASGVDIVELKKETGFRSLFGPVYARDIPAYLEANKQKTESMRRFDFGLRHRVDMFLPMNFPVYLLVVLVLAVFWPGYILGYTLIFWGMIAFMYAFIDWIPGKTGWGQAMFTALATVAAGAGIDWWRVGDPLEHWGWLLATIAIAFAAGFDLAGTVSPRRSDAELLLHRLGFSSFGSLFSEKALGYVTLDPDRCKACQRCFEVCPIGVFGPPDEQKKTTIQQRNACFGCSACVKQCASGALSLS